MNQLVIVTVPQRLSLAERMELERSVRDKFATARMAVEVLVLDEGRQLVVLRPDGGAVA